MSEMLKSALLSFTLLLAPVRWFTLSGQLDFGDMASDLAGALTFNKYATYDQYVSMMQAFAAGYPALCRLDTFGTSAQGRLLLSLKISDHPEMEESEARFLFTATMHGDELLGYPLMLRLIQTLLSGYGNDPEVTGLVDGLEIWINPLSNPDGTFRGGDHTVAGSVRQTSEGRDLNRDFPDPSAFEPDDTTGRAVETQAMMTFLRKHRFTLSANLHSGAEVVNYPWDHTYALHADDPWFRLISREYADEAHAVDPAYLSLNGGYINGAEWLVILHGRQDYVTYYLEGREVTLELSDIKKLDSDSLDIFWHKNRRSLLNYMWQCMYGIRGRVTDRMTGESLSARIAIPGHDSVYSIVHSREAHGDFYRLIAEGTYTLVVSADGYLPDTLTDVEVLDFAPTFLDVPLEPEVNHIAADLQGAGAGRIYPNPVLTELWIDPGRGITGRGTVSVYSADGQLMIHSPEWFGGDPICISVEDLHSGIYILRIATGSVSRSWRFVRK
jgi:hypothetical protein